MRRSLSGLGLRAVLLAGGILAATMEAPSGAARAQAPSEAERPSPKAKAQTKPSARARGKSATSRPGFYKGRRIADVMSYLGADWLLRESREEEEQPEAMLDALKIPEGATVADIGAGVGFTSLKLARRVGPKGTVLATDLQPEMIAMLRENVRAAGATNVKPLLCTVKDTKLPDGQVDLVIMVDVYHESSDPETTLKGILKALKPGGRLVLVEFRGEDPTVPIKPEHKMTLGQARLEVEPMGFHFKESLEFLPWQHVIIFEKPKPDAGAAKESDAKPQPPALGSP